MKLMNLITEDKIIQGKDYKISEFADKASGNIAFKIHSQNPEILKAFRTQDFANASLPALATLEVDTSGNLQCYSLKETSLREYKHDIYYIAGFQLENISKLKPITFLYNTDNPEDVNDVQIRQAGFIAEQVEQIYPEVAWYKENKIAGLQYQRLTAYLVKGVQQLNENLKIKDTIIEDLSNRITTLERQMFKLKNK